MKKVVTIGGGGGHAALLNVLRDFPIDLTALCNTVDDGGGSGELMRKYRVHHPGEVRRVISALAGEKGKELEKRSPDGQAFGNIKLKDYELEYGDFFRAIEEVKKYYGVPAAVLPVTSMNPVLHARTNRGTEIAGQSKLVKHLWSVPGDTVEELWVDPADASLSPGAEEALLSADYIIVAMGDLYSSIAPSFCLNELQAMWPQIHAKVVWFPNLVAPASHVHYKTTSRALVFLQTLTPGFQPDIVVAHTAPLSEGLTSALQSRGYMVSTMDVQSSNTCQLIGGDLLDQTYMRQKSAGDVVERSPIRYDLEKIRHIFETILV